MKLYNYKLPEFLIFSVLPTFPTQAWQPVEDFTHYANLLIGTKEIGYIFPEACVALEMLQLSPDTNTILYAVSGKYAGTGCCYCAGHRYNTKTIERFSHIHLRILNDRLH